MRESNTGQRPKIFLFIGLKSMQKSTLFIICSSDWFQHRNPFIWSDESCFPRTLTGGLAFIGYLGTCVAISVFLNAWLSHRRNCESPRFLEVVLISESFAFLYFLWTDSSSCCVQRGVQDLTPPSPQERCDSSTASACHTPEVPSQEILSFFLLFSYLQQEEIQTGREGRQETKYCIWCIKIPRQQPFYVTNRFGVSLWYEAEEEYDKDKKKISQKVQKSVGKKCRQIVCANDVKACLQNIQCIHGFIHSFSVFLPITTFLQL